MINSPDFSGTDYARDDAQAKRNRNKWNASRMAGLCRSLLAEFRNKSERG